MQGYAQIFGLALDQRAKLDLDVTDRLIPPSRIHGDQVELGVLHDYPQRGSRVAPIDGGLPS
jgi:hypothetical protein